MTQSSTPPEPAPPRHVTVSAVNWKNVLEFTHLFRGFRLATNPAKIMLALAALVLIYFAGRCFDLAWGPQVYPGEINAYQQIESRGDSISYREKRDRLLDGHVAGASLDMLLREQAMADRDHFPGDQIDTLRKSPRAAYRALKASYVRQFQATLSDLANTRADREKLEKMAADNGKNSIGNPFLMRDSKTPAQEEQDERAAAAAKLLDKMDDAQRAVGRGIFASLMDFELQQFDALIDNTFTLVRISPAQPARVDVFIPGGAVSAAIANRDTSSLWRSDTIVGCISNMTITGPLWLVSANAPMQWHADNPNTWGDWCKMIAYRTLYLGSVFLFLLFSVIVLALTGGTISRLSAMELAGIERASLSEIFLFSLRRLWVFIKAPITPFLIILVVGLFLTAVSLIGAIPYVGEIILGVFFIGLLLVGFVLMLLILGILGGLNLLFPTIAVEGADAFDAMSRSFAYVYARPWRLIFYSVISLVYGAITYIFVSFVVYLVLVITHTFAGWGANFFGHASGHYSGLAKLDTLWPAPRFLRLIPHGSTNWYAMNWSECIGAAFLHFWVYLLVATIGAYVISYYFSTHTIIYLLLRRSVDGQATTDVFLEQPAPTSSATEPTPPATTQPVA